MFIGSSISRKSLRAKFGAKLPQWLTHVTGTAHCAESAVHVQPIKDLPGLERYVLKGMDPRYAPRYRVRHVPQGVVYGKRCGVSKSLGPASRAH
jgi:hypothetical protein